MTVYGSFSFEKNGQLKYCSSNPVGGAALLYQSALGPLREKTAPAMAFLDSPGEP